MNGRDGDIVLGTTGLPGSGKSEVANIAQEVGFRILTGGDVVRQEARNRGLELTDENLAELTDTLREQEGKGVLARRCIEMIDTKQDSAILVDSFRNQEETNVFRDKYGSRFHLIAVEAPFEERLQRLKNRSRTDDISTREELRERDKREYEWGVGNVIDAADITLRNDGTLEEFEIDVRKVLSEFLEGDTAEP